MVKTTITPQERTLSFTIPESMVGHELKIIAYAVDEETEVIEGLSASRYEDEANIHIPQWQKDLVLAEQKRIEKDPSLLVDWETVKQGLRARKK